MAFRTLALVLAVTIAQRAAEVAALELDFRIPDFVVKRPDTYLCTSVALPDTPHKLVGVRPLAQQEVVHHILLFGCTRPIKAPVPGQPAPVWDCSGSATCHDGNIIYGWGRNAPSLQLPEGVGFSVGPGSSIQYIVAQVHYLETRPPGDRSGVQLQLLPQPTPFAGGLLAFARGFSIPPFQPSYLVENECCYQGHQPLTTFAMRVHTHTLGKAVFMTRQKHDNSGMEVMGLRDPQLPQGFVDVAHNVIWPGDRLKVTCDFNSTSRTAATYAGSTHHDEMCNMYMMVFAPQPHIVMCSDSNLWVSETTPGSIPRAASFLADPSPGWQPPDPKGPLGDVTSITIAADGTLWGLYRGSHHWDGSTFIGGGKVHDPTLIPEAVVVNMEAEGGRVLRSWGSNTFHMPHMVTVDRQNDVWVVDTGRAQVLKFTADGKLLLSVGQQFSPGAGPQQLCMPTQVFVLRDGSFYISDGYCNSRVVKYDAAGNYLGEASIPKGQVIHSVLVDECKGRLYALSRENSQAYAFSTDNLLLQATYDLTTHGRAWALRMGPFSEVLVLAWREGQAAQLVNMEQPKRKWTIPGMDNSYPHDFALGAAPMAMSGASDRLFALYIAPVCSPPGCGPLRRFVLVPEGFMLQPPAAALPAAAPAAAAVLRGVPMAGKAVEAAVPGPATVLAGAPPPAAVGLPRGGPGGAAPGSVAVAGQEQNVTATPSGDAMDSGAGSGAAGAPATGPGSKARDVTTGGPGSAAAAGSSVPGDGQQVQVVVLSNLEAGGRLAEPSRGSIKLLTLLLAAGMASVAVAAVALVLLRRLTGTSRPLPSIDEMLQLDAETAHLQGPGRAKRTSA